MDFSHWTIQKKIYSLFAIVASFIGILGIIIFSTFSSLESSMNELHTNIEEVKLIKDLQLQTSNVWQFLTDASLVQDEASIIEAGKAFDAGNDDIKKLKEISTEHSDRLETLSQIENAFPALLSTGKEMMKAYGESKTSGDQVMEKFDAAGSKVIDSLNPLTSEIIQSSNDDSS